MEPIVRTSYGPLRGAIEGAVHVFRGIPYARPPVGPLRFRPPERPEPWTGIRDATRFAPAAPQNAGLLGPLFSLGIVSTAEDCLALNVWTPGLDGPPRPVLVWIHGGAFVIGAGSQALYDGAALARRGNLVVVTINYRLGALGFLRLRDLSAGHVPAGGNEGLLDQIAALRWVRDEIAAFGGDPGAVTIAGESAGAMSCAALLGAPPARGLFHRAILESGAGNYVSSVAEASGVARELLAALRVRPSHLDRLLAAPADLVVDAQGSLFLSLRRGLGLLGLIVRVVRAIRRRASAVAAPLSARNPAVAWLRWLLGLPWRGLGLLLVEPRRWPQGLPLQPVVDGDVLPRPPLAAIADGLSAHVPLLVGTNRDEVKLFRLLDRGATRLDEPSLVARCEAVIPGRDLDGCSRGRRAVDVYRQARAARGESVSPAELWFAIESDRTFRFPAMRLAELQRAHQPRVFAYLFTWPSPVAGGVFGACHALELPFVFDTVRHPLIRAFSGSGPAAEALAGHIQDAWIAFARCGDPSHPGLGTWPAYDAERRATMILGAECRVEEAPREPERAFWEPQDAGPTR